MWSRISSAQFDAAESRHKKQSAGQILVVDNGGSVAFYVGKHDPETIRLLVEHLKSTKFAGVIFAQPRRCRDPALPGTFTLERAAINTPDAPDVVVAMRWTDRRSATGKPGLLVWCDGGKVAGQGHHGSLSRFDAHNTLVASGPDFKRGFESPYPSGNADITPTLCTILKIPRDQNQTGRELKEALVEGQAPKSRPATTIVSSGDDNSGWQQYLKLTEFEGCTYLDEGGRIAPSKAAP